MAKGAIPIPYIVALIFAVIVIAVVAYMFFTHTGIFFCTSREVWCEGKKVKYCFDWYKISPNYEEDKRPDDWEAFAPDCKVCGVRNPSSENCKLI